MLNSPQVRDLIRLAVAEDLGGGDITSELTIPGDLSSKALIIARQELVFCGGPLIRKIFDEFPGKVKISLTAADGEKAYENQTLIELEGQARDLLAAERTVLNFLQRLSGIATFTRHIVSAIEEMTVLDTRKTTPGWRILEKYAVRTGGGKNHRFHLSDMILVKDNHIDANGGSIERTLEKIFDGKPYYIPVEVEVRSIAELKKVLNYPVNVVMLDNMEDDVLKESLSILKGCSSPVEIEVSGGIGVERMKELFVLGVRCVSLGRLTTHAVNTDISMKIEK